MKLRLYRGTKLLDENGIYQGGNLYIPEAALESHVGMWRSEAVFLDSPLAGKRICVTVLGPGTFKQGLPPTVELFLSLCSAAGAQIIYYDGGKIPAGDLIIALEIGGVAPNVSYLGAAFRSKPLAKKIVASLKRGLKLTYLPDPIAFSKSQYNIKLGLVHSWLTPAVAVQLPAGLEEVGPWLFTSLMEYAGNSPEMDAQDFLIPALPITDQPLAPSAPEPDPQPEQPSPDPEMITQPKAEPQKKPRALPSVQPKPMPTPGTPGMTVSSSSASMSKAQYPEFFAQLAQKRRPVKKEPFT